MSTKIVSLADFAKKRDEARQDTLPDCVSKLINSEHELIIPRDEINILDPNKAMLMSVHHQIAVMHANAMANFWVPETQTVEVGFVPIFDILRFYYQDIVYPINIIHGIHARDIMHGENREKRDESAYVFFGEVREVKTFGELDIRRTSTDVPIRRGAVIPLRDIVFPEVHGVRGQIVRLAHNILRVTRINSGEAFLTENGLLISRIPISESSETLTLLRLEDPFNLKLKPPPTTK